MSQKYNIGPSENEKDLGLQLNYQRETERIFIYRCK